MKTAHVTVRVAAILCLGMALACLGAIGCSKRPPQGTAQGGAQGATGADSLAARGELVFDRTPRYAARYVGNKLACGDCHGDSGKAGYAAPMIDVAGLFPMFSKRAGHMISLKDRIDECFVRSENGQPPPSDSAEMLALVAYIDSLSKGQNHGKPYAERGLVKLPELKGNAARGKLVYAKTGCETCHGSDGAGVPPFLPPLWGPNSFNDGAGMDKPAKMAAYVYHNMPQNNPGSLTPQQAYDVTAYIQRMPRPKFNQAYKSY